MSRVPTVPRGAERTVDAWRQVSAAPHIHFDLVPALGLFNGSFQIELYARVLTPTEMDHPDVTAECTARLRCTRAAAESLRDALNTLLEAK